MEETLDTRPHERMLDAADRFLTVTSQYNLAKRYAVPNVLEDLFLEVKKAWFWVNAWQKKAGG